MGLWVQGFMGSRVYGFMGSRVYGFKGLWVYGFKGLRVEDLVVIVGMEVIERSREHRGFRSLGDLRI
jgi:hypothetical protein